MNICYNVRYYQYGGYFESLNFENFTDEYGKGDALCARAGGGMSVFIQDQRCWKGNGI